MKISPSAERRIRGGRTVAPSWCQSKSGATSCLGGQPVINKRRDRSERVAWWRRSRHEGAGRSARHILRSGAGSHAPRGFAQQSTQVRARDYQADTLSRSSLHRSSAQS
jgi:hypothetical protein